MKGSGYGAYARGMVLFAIRVYQKTLSLDHGPLARVFPFLGCRFYPSCSNYTHEAIHRYGIFKGSWLGFKRVLRCHPGSHGGHDPVPELTRKEKRF